MGRRPNSYDGGCTPDQREFIEWLVNPQREGTMTDYGDRIGVSRNTLARWKKEKSFVAEWEKRLAELNVDPDRIQDVINAIHQRATNGDTNAAKLYLEYIQKFTPTQRVITEDKSVSGMSDEELADAAEEHISHLRAVE